MSEPAAPARSSSSRSASPWAGRRALVTGGSSGIGLAVARRLVAAGARVAIVARREAPLRAACDALQQAAPGPIRPTWVPLDVSDAEAVQAGVDRCADALGGLDLLVNNAGAAWAGTFLETPPERFRELLEVNFLGVVHVTRAALPHLVRAGRGDVAIVSSFAGLFAPYGYTAYAPTKYAATGFAEALRQELRPHGIGVSVVFPTDTDTPQLAEENRHKPAVTREISGTARVLTPDEVADALLEGVARGRFWIVPGLRARALAALIRHVPSLARRVVDYDVARVLRRQPGARGEPG
ncbi:MAG: SDR family oxidoreductase [Myxococcota bacterium]|nr:SDR family oxidoreductase [Myxococcota bacterium]